MTPVTGALVVLNVLVFIWQLTTGGLDDDAAFIKHGALARSPVLVDGQWWRLVTGGFLHGGFAHIAFNMIALWQLGTFIEQLVGPWRMLLIYTLSLLGAGLAVVYFGTDAPTVGASGAIYGLFGALIAVGLRLGPQGRRLISATLPILIINIVLTLTIPHISVAGHFGGLASGFVVALLMQRRPGAVLQEEEVAQTLAGEEPAPLREEPHQPQ